MPGPLAGTCQPIVAECNGAAPGDVVCQGTSRVICGPDLVTTLALSSCTNQGCVDGVCTGGCTPESIQCSANGVQTCDASNAWSTIDDSYAVFCGAIVRFDTAWPYPVPCINCAVLSGGSERANRSISFNGLAADLVTSRRNSSYPTDYFGLGIRCARNP